MKFETWWLVSGDDLGDFTYVKWRRCWRLGGWGLEAMWRLGRCGVQTTLETWQLGSGDDVGDVAAGEWR